MSNFVVGFFLQSFYPFHFSNNGACWNVADPSEPPAGFWHLQRSVHRGFTTKRAPLLESAIQAALDVPKEIPD